MTRSQGLGVADDQLFRLYLGTHGHDDRCADPVRADTWPV